MKILLLFAASCTTAVTGWSQLLANWIGDGHCAGGGSPCTLMKCPVLSHDGMRHWSAMCGSCGAVWKYCHTRCLRGSGCGKVQSDTQVELAYDGVEGSTYVIGTWTAMVSRMLAQTWKDVEK